MKHFQNVVFISDARAYLQHEKRYAEINRTKTLFLLLDLDVAALLPEDSEYLYLQDLIATNDQHIVSLDFLQKYISQFYPNLLDIEYNNSSLWNVVKHTFLYAYKPILLVLTGLETLSQNHTWQHFYVASDLNNPVYLNTGGVFETDTIQAAMAYWCIQHNIQVNWLKAPVMTESSNQYIRHIVSETNLGPGYHSPHPLSPEYLQQFFKHPEKPCIFFVGNSTCLHDAHLLVNALKTNPDYNLVYLSTQHIFVSEHTDSYLSLDFRCVYTWPFLNHETRLQYNKRIKEALSTPNKELTNTFSAAFDNPFLKFQYLFLEKVCQEAINLMAVSEVILSVFSPQLVLFGYGHITKDVAAVIEVFKNKMGQTAHFIHGSYLPKTKLKELPEADFLLARGKHIRTLLTENNEAHLAKKVRIIGDLRPENIQVPPPSKLHPNKEITKPAKILILSNRIFVGPNLDYLSDFSFEAYAKSFESLINLAKKRHDYSFSWKPHPRHDYINYYQRLPQKVIHFHNRDDILVNILKDVDICVLLNSFSGSMVEAAIAGIPTLQLRTAFKDVYGIHSHFIHDSQVCNNLGELEQALDILISDKQAREQNIEAVFKNSIQCSAAIGQTALEAAETFVKTLNMKRNENTLLVKSAEAAALNNILLISKLQRQLKLTQDTKTYQQALSAIAQNDHPTLAYYLKQLETWA